MTTTNTTPAVESRKVYITKRDGTRVIAECECKSLALAVARVERSNGHKASIAGF